VIDFIRGTVPDGSSLFYEHVDDLLAYELVVETRTVVVE
jgi:hypothetical protein